MIITINNDLTSNVTTDDGLFECNLPSYNPETLQPFGSQEDVRIFAETIEANPNYFSKIPTEEEKLEAFVSSKGAFILSVKSEAGALTAQVLQGLGSEYELAEKEATAYKATGYPATPIPGSVQSEINSKAAKGVTITATTACDTILAAATGWRNAQAELRDNRLITVSAAEVAVDAAALDAIKAGWATFMASLRTSLGV